MQTDIEVTRDVTDDDDRQLYLTGDRIVFII